MACLSIYNMNQSESIGHLRKLKEHLFKHVENKLF